MTKSGYIEFRSQQDINKSRREKTNIAYKKLQKQIQSILDENQQIVQNVVNRTNH